MSEVIDHAGIRVSDLATSRRMYEAALAELGFAVLALARACREREEPAD